MHISSWFHDFSSLQIDLAVLTKELIIDLFACKVGFQEK